jgi:glucosamine-6-phosphate deaminase
MSVQGFDFRMAKWMPFQDQEACRRVAAIKRGDIAKHPNPEVKIEVINDGEFSFRLVTDIFSGSRTPPRRGGGWC